jgi:putative transposase
MLTYRFRLKDSSASWLGKTARATNFVWNYCNETSINAWKSQSKFLSAFDLIKLTTGASKELGLHSQTVNAVCEEYATRRKQFKKVRLRWRGKRSLGWIPFKASGIKVTEDSVRYFGHELKFWSSRPIEGKIKTGSFSQDARGRWYLNIVAEGPQSQEPCLDGQVGIDLGSSTLATLSNGKKYPNHRYLRRMEFQLSKAQKDGKKKRTKAIHAKIKNSRTDTNHKITTEIAREYKLIVCGDIGSKQLAKTKMAKSTYDASWYQIKSFLKYKANARKGLVVLVNEARTSQTCSCCGEISTSSPRGLKGLGIREWVCSLCNSVLDRDVNAALNILRLGC